MTQEVFEKYFETARKLMKKTKDANHDWGHVERVMNRALKIKNLLSEEKQQQVDDSLLKLICVWHDASYIFYKAGIAQYFLEGKREAKVVEKYIDSDISSKEKEILVDAVKHHTWADLGRLNRKRSLCHQLLQDADWLDEFSQERAEGVKELAKKSVYWWLAHNFVMPIFFGRLKKNKAKHLNLKESQSLIT